MVAASYRIDNKIFAATNAVETGLAIAPRDTHTPGHLRLLIELMWLKYTVGDCAAGLAIAQEAQALAKVCGELRLEAEYVRLAMIFTSELGQKARAVGLCAESMNLLNLCGLSGTISDFEMLATQATIHLEQTEYRKAHESFSRVHDAIAVDIQPHLHVYALRNLCDLDIVLGAPRLHVQQRIHQGMSICSSHGYSMDMAFFQCLRADLELREGEGLAAMNSLVEVLKQMFGKDGDLDGFCLERLGALGQFHEFHALGNYVIHARE
ncbi:hypothetical protein B0H19DRAFT_1060325 [Mycena capillaripes]|nr:hypothetical protein B0H19DRAFT_1060325 [Mycena capillaripes]